MNLQWWVKAAAVFPLFFGDADVHLLRTFQYKSRGNRPSARSGARGSGGIHLHVLLSCLSEFFQPELALAGVDRRRWSNAGALAVRSRGDGLHSVEVVRAGVAFFYSPAGALAQGSDNTFTPTVRAFREGFHFVIITQQL